MVAVDTSVFSLFLRRQQTIEQPYLNLFRRLFDQNQIVLLGVVYQELLSGVKHEAQFYRLSNILDGFEIASATPADHLRAAEFFNVCRAKGVQGSSIDFLICAMSERRQHQILTLDADFEHYAHHLPIQLLTP